MRSLRTLQCSLCSVKVVLLIVLAWCEWVCSSLHFIRALIFSRGNAAPAPDHCMGDASPVHSLLAAVQSQDVSREAVAAAFLSQAPDDTFLAALTAQFQERSLTARRFCKAVSEHSGEEFVVQIASNLVYGTVARGAANDFQRVIADARARARARAELSSQSCQHAS